MCGIPETTKSNGVLVRGIFGLLGAYCLCTACWIIWGILTPGDYFANGSLLFMPSLVVAGAAGFTCGFRIRRRTARLVVVPLVLASTLFWTCVPEGWWAKPPPMPVESQTNNDEQTSSSITTEVLGRSTLVCRLQHTLLSARGFGRAVYLRGRGRITPEPRHAAAKRWAAQEYSMARFVPLKSEGVRQNVTRIPIGNDRKMLIAEGRTER